MDFRKTFNAQAKTEANTGLGTNASSYGGRFFTKSGKANIRLTGFPFLDTISWYHTMLTLPRWKFLLIILLFYFLVNAFFATLYVLIGVDHLNGVTFTSPWDAFGQAFFFSVQTFTTVGYGHVSPRGFLASFIAAVEALSGLLSFAIATGLFYGRFSQPKAHLLFSNHALIAPYKDGTALMLRLCPFKNVNLSDAEARVTLGMHVEENGQKVNKFFTLDLELDKINALNLNWTLVHPITPQSPLYQFTESDFQDTVGELIVFIKVFDDMFSTSVVKRASYTFDEVVYGARFLPMFSRDGYQRKTLLHIDKLHAFEKVTL